MPEFDLDAFHRVLEASGLVTGGARRAVERILDQSHDPRGASDLLVAEGILTRWQAERILAGKSKGFQLGQYRLLDRLGAGGMSHVYLAQHTIMKRRVAIKVLSSRRAEDPAYRDRFLLEAQAAAALNHPHIVAAYDVSQEGGVYYLVMEYVEGKDLRRFVEESGPLSYALAADIVRQAAIGLDHAHRAGLVHRDIKPANLIIDREGLVKILDLGLALFKDSPDPSLTLQYGHQVLGTADYLAPEQAIDSHTVDHRADVYALGCTFYFALTGRPPFPEGTVAQRVVRHRREQPPSIFVDRPDAPDTLVAICQRMMAKDPDERFGRAMDVADALSAWLAGGAIQAGADAGDPSRRRHGEPGDAAGEVTVAAEASPTSLASISNAPQAGVGERRDYRGRAVAASTSAAQAGTPRTSEGFASGGAAPPWFWVLVGAVLAAIGALAVIMYRLR